MLYQCFVAWTQTCADRCSGSNGDVAFVGGEVCAGADGVLTPYMALELAAMQIFENYWPGARDECMRLWEEPRRQPLGRYSLRYYPTRGVVKTMLNAWREVTFSDGRRPDVAPGPERVMDELFASAGSVPTWRVIWEGSFHHKDKIVAGEGLRSQAWSADRAARTERIQRAVMLYRRFPTWTLVLADRYQCSRGTEAVLLCGGGGCHHYPRRG